ncbi:MAG: mercury resistance system transport protein MerF [Pseudomonadota bacterium]
MSSTRLFRVGVVGTIFTAICCFTPVLVWILGALGLSAAVGWLDLVLLPLLVIFLGSALYAFWKRRMV